MSGMQPPTGGGSGGASAQVSDYAVGYWPMYENIASGTRHDMSGNVRPLADSALVASTTGQCNAKCASFTSGLTNQLSATNAAFANTNSHLTIMLLHFATTHSGGGEYYLIKGTGADGGATTPDWSLSSATPGALDFSVTDSTHAQKTAEAAGITNSALYFLVLRYNPRTAKIGISATLLTADTMNAFVETAMPNPMIAFAWPLRVSGNGFGGGHFTGTCEELAIIKGLELSAVQLENFFQKVKAGRPLFR